MSKDILFIYLLLFLVPYTCHKLFIDKMTHRNYFIITLFAILLISCERKINMSSFYFPLAELQEGLVYTYSSVNMKELDDEVWFYKSIATPKDTILAGQAYSMDGRVEQLVVERRVDLGVIQDSLILYHTGPDSLDIPVSCTVGPGSVFPFYQNKADTLEYKVAWTDPADSLSYILRRRKAFSHDTTFLFDGRELPAVSFWTNEAVETFRKDIGTTESAWNGEEIYAQGVGLVYYRKEISPDFVKAYQLSHRTDMSSFLNSTTKF